MLYIPYGNPYACVEALDDEALRPSLEYLHTELARQATPDRARKRPWPAPDELTYALEARDSIKGWCLHYFIALLNEYKRRFNADHPAQSDMARYRQWDHHYCEPDQFYFPRQLKAHRVDLSSVADLHVAHRMLLTARWLNMKDAPRWSKRTVPMWTQFQVFRRAAISEDASAAETEGPWFAIHQDVPTGQMVVVSSDILPASRTAFLGGLALNSLPDLMNAAAALALREHPERSLRASAVVWPIPHRDVLKGYARMSEAQTTETPAETPAPKTSKGQYELTMEESKLRRLAVKQGLPWIMSSEEAAAREASGSKAPEDLEHVIITDRDARLEAVNAKLAELGAAAEAAKAGKAEAKKAEREAAKAKKDEERAAAKAAREAAKAAKAAQAKEPKAPKVSGGGNSLGLAIGSDWKIFSTRDGNPRREGSHGWHSHKIVLAAMPDGITVKDFQDKGGRRGDLQWDLKHGHMKVVEPDGTVHHYESAAPAANAAAEPEAETAQAA
jgi:hypothetical protein